MTTAAFTTPDQLDLLVYQALQDIHISKGPTALPPTQRAAGGGTAWSIPAQTVDVTGRDDLLDGRARTLREDRRAVAHAALHGIGGIGKTTAATENAHRHAGDYDVAWWVPAQDPTLIPDALADLAQALPPGRTHRRGGGRGRPPVRGPGLPGPVAARVR
ncbi:MAG TPA: hypothetical protein VHN80_23945, partial [Kineosporiaceae bacterium]|nr:hypothetical protein [Kineosporiaceae bacterium]